MRDFTQQIYQQLLKEILKAGYKTYSVCEYLQKKPKNRFIILRHDVDRALGNALQLAKIEESLGVRSTYYFRTSTFKLPEVQQISDLGHEIGYHYETLFKAKGNYALALNLFEQELQNLRFYFSIKTICAHGNIFMKGINYDIWKKYDFKRYDIIGEAYLSITNKTKSIVCLSDTGRIWTKFESTDKLIFEISKKEKNYYLLVHPDKWEDCLFFWLKIWLFQIVKNKIKRHILPFLGLRK